MRQLLELIFAGRVPLAFQNPYPIIVYSVAKYRPHLSHFFFFYKTFLTFTYKLEIKKEKKRKGHAHLVTFGKM